MAPGAQAEGAGQQQAHPTRTSLLGWRWEGRVPGEGSASQNPSMAGVGRELCGSSSPTPLPKQDHPGQAAQDLVQARSEYLQRRRIVSGARGAAQGSATSTCDDRQAQPVCSSVSSPCSPAAGKTQRSHTGHTCCPTTGDRPLASSTPGQEVTQGWLRVPSGATGHSPHVPPPGHSA